MKSFSSWYIRKNPKLHSDNKFSSWFLCQVWSGFRPSYSATLEQAATDQPQILEPLPWTLFIPSSISTSFIFHVYLSFSVSKVWMISRGLFLELFGFFTSHILLIQLFLLMTPKSIFSANPACWAQQILPITSWISYACFILSLMHCFSLLYFLSTSAPLC